MHIVQYMSKTEGYHPAHTKYPKKSSNLHELHESIRNGRCDFTGMEPKKHHYLEIYNDSDWAGKKDTRRSASAGTIFSDGQVIYTFFKEPEKRKSVALSSGEAEYYAGTSAASRSILRMEALPFFAGKRCQVQLHLDSSAAGGIITRQGAGRIKHLQIRATFLQDLHKQGILSVHRVGTKHDTADIGTKPVSGKHIKLLMHWLGFQDGDNDPVGKEGLKKHRTQLQAKASVRMIKSNGKFGVAALLFSAIASISEGTPFQLS